MRYSAAEKAEMIHLIEQSNLPIRQTLQRLDITKSTFYNWLQRFDEGGSDGLHDRKPKPGAVWNKLSQGERDAIIELVLAKPELSPEELAASYTDRGQFVSELDYQRLITLMRASDKFQQPTRRINEMWQSDFSYFKILDWGWYYLSTVLDDYSRYIVAWRACTSMKFTDVSATLDAALTFTELDTV